MGKRTSKGLERFAPRRVYVVDATATVVGTIELRDLQRALRSNEIVADTFARWAERRAWTARPVRRCAEGHRIAGANCARRAGGGVVCRKCKNRRAREAAERRRAER